MAKGGSESKSETKLPAWYVPYAKQGLELGSKVGQQGYTPYTGPNVAAFAPQQVAAMQSANDWSAAMGGKGAKSANVAASLPKAETFAGGLKGYSTIGGYDEALAKLKKRSPGLYDYITKFSVNPQTGAPAQAYQQIQQGIPGFPGQTTPPPVIQPGQPGQPGQQQPYVPQSQFGTGSGGPNGGGHH